ncbi:MAG: hypothetical protein HF312_10765 [Ignavibacteria bacterium]|jgi:hypothetical protein|nr:hypothetical protein [Ignavibacteria bacterium]MCU7520685.1 hypothetical protein [Ignavibacteria bacterium]
MDVLFPKMTYLVDEPVEFGLTVSNKDKITYKGLSYHTVLVKVLDSKGKALPYTGWNFDFFSPTTEELKPGEENYHIISLTGNFGKHHPYSAMQFIPAGAYNLKIYLKPQGVITDSISIPFQVIEPSGDELIVHNGYVDAIENQSPEKRVETLRHLADSYPNSIYLAPVLTLLRITWKISLDNEEKGLEIADEMIEKCPGYREIFYFIPDKFKTLNSKSERLELLKRIQSDKKNILLRKQIENLIKEEF